MLSVLLPVLTVVSAAIVVWLTLKRARQEAPWLFEDEPPCFVEVTETGLRVETAGAPPASVAWSEIRSVRIRTTDRGPFVEDAHWEIERDGGTPLVVPNAAQGIQALLQGASEQLAGFDHDAVIEAMACVDNRTFHVWTRSA